jgi:hypothetical protein
LLESEVRVHIIFYSLRGNIDILPVDLHWQCHFCEYFDYVLSLDDSLLGGLVNVAVVLEQSVEDLLLRLGQLDVVRVCVVLGGRSHTDSTRRLEDTHAPERGDRRHCLETREFFAFISGESCVRES